MPPVSAAKSNAMAKRHWGEALLCAGLLIALPGAVLAQTAPAASHGHSEAVFVAQIILLLLCGRLLGEGMQRIGQPAIMGQLLAGVVLGPSVLGVLWPAAERTLFPAIPEQKAMIDAVSQFGILMLLLLTGMETDLALVRRTGKAALSVSLAGIAVPFLCGIALGEALPDSMLPHPDQRLVTTLFIGTALAIASVKIVALTIHELDFLRRTIGQLIVTAAIVDDTIGWILLSIILGLAGHGTIDLASIGQSVLGTLLFMPVFFGMAGLQANLAVLGDPVIFGMSVLLILIASLGKFSGAFLGGTIGGLNWRECLALGWGMNARGSTEVVVATIGLSMGALSQTLFTMILVMAVATTMAMPPMLRWSLARVPLREDEEVRLKREAFEAEGFVPNIERLLVMVDDSPSGHFASRLAGLLAGSRRIPTTILEAAPRTRQRRNAEAVAKATASTAAPDTAEADAPAGPVDITTRPQSDVVEEAVAREACKGYDLLFIGIEPVAQEDAFDDKVARIAGEFKGAFAIAAARGSHRRPGIGRALEILVPVTGNLYSRRGAEVALALARADHGSVTALYVAQQRRSWHRRVPTPRTIGADGEAIPRGIRELGDRSGVPVRTAVRRAIAPAAAIPPPLPHGSAQRPGK